MFNLHFNNVSVDVKKHQIKLPDGKILDESLCSDICLAYERMCTANYLIELGHVKQISKAWEKANEVRELMDDYGLLESEAIDQVF